MSQVQNFSPDELHDHQYSIRQINNPLNATEILHEHNYPIQSRNINSYILGTQASVICRSRPAYNIQNEADIELVNIGSITEECSFCGALHFFGEKTGNHFSGCCRAGNIRLTPIHEPPQRIKDLLTQNSPISNHFITHIRKYNNTLAFGTFNTNFVPPTPGIFAFKIHGQVYRLTSHLESERESPQCAQLYILDSEEANAIRETQAVRFHINKELLTELHNLLSSINPYAQSFKMLDEVCEQERILHGDQYIPELKMVFNRDPTLDFRIYNPARVSEIAAVFNMNEDFPRSGIDITIYPKAPSSNTQANFVTISHKSPHSDPMLYPIIFPFGDRGWSYYLHHERNTTRNIVTLREFYSYHLYCRTNVFSQLHHAGRLFQQYLVDAYTKIEANECEFLRRQQQQFRIEHYQGLSDFINQRNNNINQRNEQDRDNQDSSRQRIGRRFILPASRIGSPRYYQQCYQDAIAMVRAIGKPDLFITFTCNPNWPEIKDNLFPNQPTTDRPDIVARVFHLKFEKLLSDIINEKIFGEVVGYCYSIEFQKRGLPHAHILVVLNIADKITSPEIIDGFISAEIPDPHRFPRLNEIVCSHMMHGPCGSTFPNCPCMENRESCSKDYPKPYNNSTTISAKGFPIYRRRETGLFVTRQGAKLDNAWVVPYNAFLLLRYNAHINVEACATMGAVKYLYRYIFKGLDFANIRVTRRGIADDVDEILGYLDARYVSSSEACWRIFAKPLAKVSHNIVRLAIHLPNMQSIVFVEGEEREALEQARRSRTTLTAMFELNKTDVSARTLLYADLPKHYIWNKSQKLWIKRVRQAKPTIGRIYFVSPHDSERYFLRLILLHVPGFTCFEDILTVAGTVYPTYRESAIARGLLQDDEEWLSCLEEASSFMLPSAMRKLFAIICSYCSLSDASSLFERFATDLCEDYLRNYDDYTAKQLALKDIEEIMQSNGLSLKDVNLPQPALIDVIPVREEIRVSHNLLTYDEMNNEQKKAYQAIMEAVNNPQKFPRTFFIDGPGGSGKTTLYNRLCADIKAKGGSFIAVASTGIASTLLLNGRTAHSVFKIPLNADENSVCKISVDSKQAREIRKAEIIIWDEATMTHWQTARCVKDFLEDLCPGRPYGGKVVVLGGDFRQCLPVVASGSRAEIIKSSLIMSPLWSDFTRISLQKNMRADEDIEYARWLMAVGSGSNSVGVERLDIPNCIVTQQNIIDEIFGTNLSCYTPDDMKFRSILAPRNQDTLEINELVLQRIVNEPKSYFSADEIITDEHHRRDYFPDEFIFSLTPTGMPPHILNLKVGCIIMLLRNLSPKDNLFNGTRLIIKGLHQRVISCCRFDNSDEIIFIPRITLTSESDTKLPFTLKRRQFPIRLAHAITINKSQGQTFEKVGLYLKAPVFDHGQLYVALSRVRKETDIKIKIEPTRNQGFDNNKNVYFTKNIVFQDIIQRI